MKRSVKIFATILLTVLLLSGCGNSNGGSKSSFNESAQNPVLENNQTDYYIDENTKEAFWIKATDKSLLKYYISGKDANQLYVDIFTGEVIFNEPTDFESKNLYNLKVTVEDSVSHRTSRDVKIHIINTDESTHPIINQSEESVSFSDEESNKLFITTWKTDNPGKSNRNQIIIPTIGDGYNYDVDWGDGTSTTGLIGNAIHNYSTVGTYTIKIKGDFPRISFSRNFGKSDAQKLLSIEQWGDIKWTSMAGAFAGCANLVGNARDIPDLSKVENMEYMFLGAKNFNQNIGNWNVRNVTNMLCIFGAMDSFNQDIGNWNVGRVTNMVGAFFGASSFNQDLKNWNVSNVKDMNRMFFKATSFNQNIGKWNVSGVINMSNMFANDSAFNQDISRWNVSNVVIMDSMFYKAISFNQDLESWDVDSNKTDIHGIFNETTALEERPSWYIEEESTI
jgi:surface protein